MEAVTVVVGQKRGGYEGYTRADIHFDGEPPPAAAPLPGDPAERAREMVRRLRVRREQRLAAGPQVRPIGRQITIVRDPTPAPRTEWLEGKRIVRIACGGRFHILLLDTGEVIADSVSIGSNEYGQLGRGYRYEQLQEYGQLRRGYRYEQLLHVSPEYEQDMRIPRFVGGLPRIVQIATSTNHCAAVSGEGQLFTWGANAFGQCGLSEMVLAEYNNELRAQPYHLQDVWGRCRDHDRLTATLCNVGALADPSVKITFVACGHYHTVTLTSDGQMIGFGLCDSGRIGHDPSLLEHQRVPHLTSPTTCPCAELDGVFLTGCAAEWGTTHLLSNDGRAFAMGCCDNGALGLGKLPYPGVMPTEIDPQHFNHSPIAAVSTAYCSRSTIWLTSGGSAFCANGTGTPTIISEFDGICIVSVSSTPRYQIFLADNGDMYLFGRYDKSFPEPAITNVALLAHCYCIGSEPIFIGGVPSDLLLCENRPGFHNVFDKFALAWLRRKNLICCLVMSEPGDNIVSRLGAFLLTIVTIHEWEVHQSRAAGAIFKFL